MVASRSRRASQRVDDAEERECGGGRADVRHRFERTREHVGPGRPDVAQQRDGEERAMHDVRRIGDRRVHACHRAREQRHARQQLHRGERRAEAEPRGDPPQLAPGIVAQRAAERPPGGQREREIRHLRVARDQDERGGHREPRDRPPGTDRVVERQVQGQQQPGDTGDHRDLWVLEALARDHARTDERDGRDEPGRWSEAQPVRERDHPDAEDQQMERGDQHHRAPRIETDERQLQRVEQPDLGVGQVGHPSEDGGIPLGDSPGEERTERDGFVGRRVRVRVEALDDAARSQERPRHEREEEGRTEQLEPTRPPEVAQRMWRDHTMVGVASGRRARG